jgi:uncharacterized membrane protein YdcZ (DUF606 family)
MAPWAGAALILLLPFLAMQFTDEVAWGPADFVVAGALLFGAALVYSLLARRTDSLAYRTAVGMAVMTALLLVWLNLAAGLIGSEDNPANLIYLGVLAVGLIAALIARFQPRGMARALFATALAQMLVAAIALLAGWGSPESGPLEIVALNGLFAALFVGSAVLFRKAAQGAG